MPETKTVVERFGLSLRACLKIPERGCVVLDQPQQAQFFLGVDELAACCGWSRFTGHSRAPFSVWL
jgi:hypothetical protein